MTRLVLVRHGQTAWNATHLLQGHADISLSPEGMREAASIAPLVRDLDPQSAISSDLKRAQETARLIGLDPVVDEIWREANLGSWEGKGKSELDPADYRAWRAGRFDPPGGEPWRAFRDRIGRALERVPGTGTTVVVTHGGAIRAALSILIGLEPDRIMPVDPGSLTVLDLNGSARLRSFNITPKVAAPVASI